MAKDTIGIGGSNVARLMDAGWIGVNTVARVIDEIWIGDASGKAQLAWKEGLDKVKAIFNGYVVCGSVYGDYNSTTSKSIRYDADTKKTYSNLPTDMRCVSKDGHYYVSGSGSLSVHYLEGTTLTRISYATINPENTDNIKSTSVYSVDHNTAGDCIKISPDNNRLAFIVCYQKTSSSNYSVGVVFYKKNASTGLFEYEKDICIASDITYAGSAVRYIQMSDDLSVISFSYFPTVNASWIQKIYKGSPESGYSQIYSGSSGTGFYLDEECGEYAVTSTGVLLRISGNTCTQVTTLTHNAEDLCLSYDRSVMHVTYNRTVYTYKVADTSVTLLGSYYTGLSHQYEDIFLLDEDADGNALVLDKGNGSTPSGYTATAVYYVKLTKNANGCITGYTKIASSAVLSAFTSEPTRATIKLYSTNV